MNQLSYVFHNGQKWCVLNNDDMIFWRSVYIAMDQLLFLGSFG
jgi:hypothetical protein